MRRLRVAPIVEGHGEYLAIPILLRRVWTELLGGEWVQVIQPIRRKRTKLEQPQELAHAIDLAMIKLQSVRSSDSAMILILFDADEAAPCALGPELLEIARKHRSDADISCVIANVEYETWLIAGARTLDPYLDLSKEPELPKDPETLRLGKAWVQRRFRGKRSYSPTVDQPALTSHMDLQLARERSPSFDKLCRELGKRLAQS